MISYSDEGIEKLKEIKHFKGDNTLNASCKRMLTFYKSEAENKIPVITDFLISAKEYDEMVTLFQSKNRKSLTQEEVDKYNESINAYNKGVNVYNNTNNNLNNSRNSNLIIIRL